MYNEHSDARLKFNAFKTSDDFKNSIKKLVHTRYRPKRANNFQSVENPRFNIQLSDSKSREFRIADTFPDKSKQQQRNISLSIPQKYRHGLKLFQLSLLKIQNSFANDEILKGFRNSFHLITESISKLNHSNQVFKDKLSQQQLLLKSNQKSLIWLEAQLSRVREENVKLQGTLRGNQKRQQSSERKDEFQRLKLQKLNRQLMAKINIIGQLRRYEQMQRQVKTQKLLHAKRLDELISKDKVQNDQIKLRDDKIDLQNQQIRELKEENQTLQSKLAQLQQQVVALSASLAESRYETSINRERRLMTLEDKNGQAARYSYLVNRINKLNQINKGLVSKLSKTNQKEAKVQLNPMFQYEKDFFRNLIFRSKDKLFYPRKKKTNQETLNIGIYIFDPEIDHRTDPQDKFEELNEVDLHNYTFYKPTFYSFLQLNQDCKQRDTNLMSVSQILSIVHHIFDSKFKQFLLVQDPQKYSQFPQFVYSWFLSFYIDSKTGKLAAIPIQKKRTYSKTRMIDFYKDVTCHLFDQIWEVVTFRQFLVQHQSLQEVYFYLHCRNSLFILCRLKPEEIISELRIFVDFRQVCKLVQTVLDNYEVWSVNFIKQKMKEKIIKKGQTQILDSGFVLRCLLQYYRIQRVNRLKFTRKMFQQNGGISTSISFDGFMSMFDWFQGMSVVQKVSLYRLCFAVGHGNITPQIIFTVCTQKNFYIKFLRLSSLSKFPIHLGRKNINQDEGNSTELVERLNYFIDPPMPYLYDIYGRLKKCFDTKETLFKRLEEQGVQHILANYEHFKSLINKNRYFIQSAALKGRHFVHFVMGFVDQIKRIAMSNFYILLQARKKPLKKYGQIPVDLSQNQLAQVFAKDLENWCSMLQWTQSQLAWKQKVNDFRMNCCARKIQRFINVKLLKPYIEMYEKILVKVQANKSQIVNQLRKKYKRH